MNAGTPLASDFVTVNESPDPSSVYCYSPGITRTAAGRLVATLDLGDPGTPGMADTRRVASRDGVRDLDVLGRIYTSDDRGHTWTHRGDFPFMHARPFCAGGCVYVLGHRRDLMVVRSADDGTTWSATRRLTRGGYWHQAPCNVHHAHGHVYLVMDGSFRTLAPHTRALSRLS